MGNSESSSNRDAYVIPVKTSERPLAFELDEGTALKQLFDGIPPHCRGAIAHLPQQQLLDVYRHHLKAICHLQKKEIVAASQNELQAIKRLKTLLPNNKNHYLFMEMYCVLSECLLKLDQIPDALIACKNALELLLTYTPTDYEELSIVYNRLGQCCKAQHAWADAIKYLSHAIESMRQCPTPNERSISIVQADIELIKKRISVEALMNQSNADPGESEIDFQRRKRAVIDAFYAECGSLPYNLSETKRVPDKRTETQITEKILNEVSAALIKYLNEYAQNQFKTGCKMVTFIAAAFRQEQMKTSFLSPAMIEAALTIITQKIDEYPSLTELPLILSYTDDSDSLPEGVREFIVTEKKKEIHLNETNQPICETHDNFQ